MLLLFGEKIEDLCFITELITGKNYRSKSYIYSDTKELLYEDTIITSIKNPDSFFESVYSKAIKRILNETKHNYLTDETKDSIRSYIRNTIMTEIEESKKSRNKRIKS